MACVHSQGETRWVDEEQCELLSGRAEPERVLRRSCVFLGRSAGDLLALVGTEGEFHEETAGGLAARLAKLR
eukprot:SAG22_NODE_412_length_10893_cov_14.851770_5_plen_72_part_00